MNNHDDSVLIERALSNTRILINFRDQMEDNEVENLLFQTQASLLRVNAEDEECVEISENKNRNTDLGNDIFDAIVLVSKMKHSAQLFLNGCFNADDIDKTECVMASLLSDFANEAFDMLRAIESKYC